MSNDELGVHFLSVTVLDDSAISYDSILRAERGGGVFVPVDVQGRVGLLPIWRPQAADNQRYMEAFPGIDFEKLGRVSYEVPRGFAKSSESPISAAVREAREETRREVSTASSLGVVCDNSSFSVHFAEVAWGRVGERIEDAPFDPGEGVLSTLQFFTRAELQELRANGLLYDSFTLSALALLWLSDEAKLPP